MRRTRHYLLNSPQTVRSWTRATLSITYSTTTYHNDYSKIVYSGSLLKAIVGICFESLVDPDTNLVPPHIIFEIFVAQLSEYFGGGVNAQTLERSLINLRQTGTVSDFAVAFQNIVSPE